MSSSRLSIVGAGIVGLMIALEASQRWPDRELHVVDEGLDPRGLPSRQHVHGATYSGLDARHISLTETGPWTSGSRADLIRRPPSDGGWNCLDGTSLTCSEAAWLDDFVALARQPALHDSNSASVFRLNRSGLDRWESWANNEPDLFTRIEPSRRLVIVCSTEADLQAEWVAERALDHTVSAPERTVPRTLFPLDELLARGALHGSFEVAGSAFHVKSLCARLIARLESAGVRFRWDNRIDIDGCGELNLPSGDFVWSAGASTVAAKILKAEGVLLQGVAGCWVSIPNPGFSQPFKVLAPEPVNFINATPTASELLLSGGYGWVGERTYVEATDLVRPLHAAFSQAVTRFFLKDRPIGLAHCPTAMCIRPSLPGGVPVIRALRCGRHRGVLCVGHAAGGFTQAPAVARMVLDQLD